MPNALLNALAGIDPPSTRRRRRARMQAWIPLLTYFVLAGVFVALQRDEGPESFFMGFSQALILILPSIVLTNLFRTAEVRQLQRNWQDYRMAGFSGSEMLQAFASARLRGAAWFFPIGAGAVFLLAFSQPYLVGHDELWFLFIPVMVECAFLLFVGIYLDVAMMTKPGYFFYRALAMTVLVLTGVPAVVVIVLLLTVKDNPGEIIPFGWLFGVVSLIIRGVIAANLWDAAARRLESEDFLQ